MILKDGKAIFTAMDSQNMTIKNYTDKEIKNNLKKYAGKAWNRRILLMIAFLVSMIFAVKYNTDPYSFFCYIVVILLAAGCLLSEIMYWLNRKNVTSRFYIEIVVDQKKTIETDYQNSVATGPETIHYYPIVGRDTTTNYGSVWYLDKEEYQKVKAGDLVRKNIIAENAVI